MTYTKTLLAITFSLISFILNAQLHDGALNFVGRNFSKNMPLTNVTIKVISNSKVITEFNTKNKNNFKTELPFGNDYDIYFIHPEHQTMFLRIFASKIPEDKLDYLMTYAFDVPFLRKDEFQLDTIQFLKPFHQVKYDGKKNFMDDKEYMEEFAKHVYLKEVVVKKDSVIPVKEKQKEYLKLAGKLCLDNDKQTVIKNKTVSLLNKNGDIIATSQTTNRGVFNFQKVDSEIADAISILLNVTDNPNHDKIKLLTTNSTKIDIATTNESQICTFKNQVSNKIINQLSNKLFDYNIAGKLVSSNGSVKKIAANKTVYLYNEKGEIVQTTKTNALGNFVFSNIEPDKSYIFEYENDEDPSFKMSLYSVKDKFIQELTPGSKNKFEYKFLAVSNSTFNDIVMDESELKMGMSGRLCGNNKNNPLANLKLLLLNENNTKIDSAITNTNGDFSFKQVPYSKQFSIVGAEKNSLDAFDNVLIFNNQNNLIKTIAVVKGNKFNYKPLAIEQSALSDIYVDDPWLAIIDKNKYSKNSSTVNKPIVENILFEFNKADLQAQSQLTLDKVVLAMQSNEKFKIELSAHSDSKGSDAYNLKLSEQRANASKNYIVSKGINAQRIKATGFGETKLINNCGNNAICSDDEHAVNRRLEFVLIFN